MATVYEPPGSVQAPSWWGQAQQQGQQMQQAQQNAPGPGWQANFGYTYAPTSGLQAENPHVRQSPTGWGLLGYSSPVGVSENNVMAAQGAGGMNPALGQQQLDTQAAQRQADLQGAAMARQTRGLSWQGGGGGDDPQGQWQRMMQGLSGMYYRPGSANNAAGLAQMNQQWGQQSDPTGARRALSRMYGRGY